MTPGRVGLELEWLAPPGASRDDLARALAKAFHGALRFGWKYHGHGHLPDGRPDCHLSPACRVDVRGAWFASLVDDPTIQDDLGPGTARQRVARTDDVRLAGLAERQWSRSPKLDARLAPLARLFSGAVEPDGAVDAWGHPLTRWHEVSAERARVCELVLRPLAPKERRPVLTRVTRLARGLGFTVPAESATHAHYDAAPFRSTATLRQVVLDWHARGAQWRERLAPNPRCRKLGPFPAEVLRVARAATDATLPFETFAAALLLAGLRREVDLNLLGVVERYPKQPTLEVRCLPGSLDADELLARLAVSDALVASFLA